jgi:hypothetical protein
MKERDSAVGTDVLVATIVPLAALIQSIPLVMQFQKGDVVTNYYTWRTGTIMYFDGGWPGYIWIKYADGSSDCRRVWSCSKAQKRKHSELEWR